jgi:prepilin-type N-terminal cleavage/methylation domain-containing protein
MNERGFSLVEVIAAMVILTIGVVGLAASTAAITRLTGQGGLTANSAAVAASRFDVLRATPCASLAGGTATTGKFSETWTVTTPSTYARNVIDNVTYTASRRTRTSVFSTILSCAPIGT